MQEDPRIRRQQNHRRQNGRPHIHEPSAHEYGTEDGPGDASDDNADDRQPGVVGELEVHVSGRLWEDSDANEHQEGARDERPGQGDDRREHQPKRLGASCDAPSVPKGIEFTR